MFSSFRNSLTNNFLRRVFVVIALFSLVSFATSAGASEQDLQTRSVTTRPNSYFANVGPNKTLQVGYKPNFTATQVFADPTLSISDAIGNEGDDGVFNAVTFTITLSSPSQQTVSVTASTQSGTAIGDVDFAAGSIIISIDPGKTSQTCTVFTKGDTIVEGSEQFFLNLSNPVNATISRAQGVGTIVDDDALILLTEANVQRAVALDSVLFTRDSFPIANNVNFSSDHLTRISLFAIGVKLLQGEGASAVTATAEDSQGTIRPLSVEFVGRVPTYDWLYQVVLKMNDQINTTGDIKIKITLHAASSNTVLVAVRPQ